MSDLTDEDILNLERSIQHPHFIELVDSNSPASAASLKIRDVVLAVNNKDVSESEYIEVTKAIKDVRDSNDRLELLVIQKHFYDILKENGISFNPRFAQVIDTPKQMPGDYMNFSKHTPRTCEIRLSTTDQTFGFDIVYGKYDIGAYIQEIAPDSPASPTILRKNDRVLEINDKFIDNEPRKIIEKRLIEAKLKRFIKLYVGDTHTYIFFQVNNIPLESKKF
ncbi:unnamed protein product [Rotaria sp. Silwood1]|nr:unnamed protein product [Rotaria sp. Silwood1]CAF1566491.1 unnamed protein product [Rotaria sp. Silwood1]